MREAAWFAVGLVMAGCTVIFAPETRSGSGIDDDDAGGDDLDASRPVDSAPSPDADPNRIRLVFTSSLRFGGIGYGNVPMLGLASADALCQTLAGSAGLEGSFLAWLSDADDSPSTRFSRSGTFENVLGQKIATDWAVLTGGNLDRAIDRDENGTLAPLDTVCTAGDLWSNTNPDGTTRGGDTSCNEWTGGSGNSITGNHLETDMRWTATTCDIAFCDSVALPIYCFGE